MAAQAFLLVGRAGLLSSGADFSLWWLSLWSMGSRAPELQHGGTGLVGATAAQAK